jgi:ribosomal protein S13
MKKKQKKGPAKKQKVLRKSTRHVFDVISAMPGIGVRRRHLLLGRANIVGKSARKFIDINKYHLLLRTIKKKYTTGPLLKKITSNILDLRYKYGSYKGVRMREGLPCNGQRTHSNGCTAAKRGKAIFLESVPIKAKKK